MADRHPMLLNYTEKCTSGVNDSECNSTSGASNIGTYRRGRMPRKESVLEVEGRQIKLSNLDKVLYPKVGFTKGQVIDYYVRVAPVLLPHLADRPLTLKRYPNGVDGEFFYEKNCPSHRPKWDSAS